MQQMNNEQSIPPNESDWGDPELYSFPPDRYYSMDLFLGKSIMDIMPLLETNFTMRCIDDLAYFPEPVFSYYVRGFFLHLADRVPDDEDLGVQLGVFLSVMEDRRIESPDLWKSAWRNWPKLVDTFIERVGRGRVNSETAEALMGQLREVRTLLQS
ncbi:hypothetical protein PV762_04180 [Mitsuaria sp. CC2]|uniref:hypothetical protein n=1 Tax=Mitsuaria sp. CC2 TaxID=3029186 RepID=UPI003B8B5715